MVGETPERQMSNRLGGSDLETASINSHSSIQRSEVDRRYARIRRCPNLATQGDHRD